MSELSRYGRQIWEVLESIKFCVDNGINVYFQKDGLELFDGDKVNGVMAIYISCLSFCAEKERERTLPSAWLRAEKWPFRRA